MYSYFIFKIFTLTKNRKYNVPLKLRYDDVYLLFEIKNVLISIVDLVLAISNIASFSFN